MHGGKRKGAGRKKGSTNKQIENIREYLEPYKQEIIDKAMELAREGNVAVLNKLLDKVLPNLNSVDLGSSPDKMRTVRLEIIKDRRPDEIN